jgi:hypothetical protein
MTATELCMHCGKVQPCRIEPISGGRRFSCAVCGRSQGIDLDDDEHTTYERGPDGRMTYIGNDGLGDIR